MLRVCMYCKREMGRSEPFENENKTHGICEFCMFIFRLEMALKFNILNADLSTQSGLDFLYVTLKQSRLFSQIKKFRDYIKGSKSRIVVI